MPRKAQGSGSRLPAWRVLRMGRAERIAVKRICRPQNAPPQSKMRTCQCRRPCRMFRYREKQTWKLGDWRYAGRLPIQKLKKEGRKKDETPFHADNLFQRFALRQKPHRAGWRENSRPRQSRLCGWQFEAGAKRDAKSLL